MKKYEVVIILDPRAVEGNGDAFSDAFQASMKEMGGNVTRVKFFEQRTFAYPIKKRKTGIYWDYVVEAEGTFVAALKDKYRLNQSVLRLVVFEFEDGQDDDVFNPREEHDKLIKEDNFQDAFDFDERPYRGRD
ncbi:MAG: 30S ribosomal protein S6 [Victivallales bacterium]|nr:30S ribosomal protein S6 [Victivallales bacterium]